MVAAAGGWLHAAAVAYGQLKRLQEDCQACQMPAQQYNMRADRLGFICSYRAALAYSLHAL
jgi:hypothetical protein